MSLSLQISDFIPFYRERGLSGFSKLGESSVHEHAYLCLNSHVCMSKNAPESRGEEEEEG